MGYEKIQMDKKSFDNIINELNILKLSISDNKSKIIIEKILDMMKQYKDESMLISLKEKIEQKMTEYKYKNPEASTSLYILLRKLESGKLSQEEASDIFQKLVAEEAFNRKIY